MLVYILTLSGNHKFLTKDESLQSSSRKTSYSLYPDSIFRLSKTKESYYATASHEITHYTRHPPRLDRSFDQKRFQRFFTPIWELPWSREKIMAYIASWLKALRNDKNAIFTAASHAQCAADYLYGLQ
jgi:antirestriction protein ArdC